MKIGVLGSGDVGRRLSDGFIELGHIVKIGSRDPTKE
jgi:8-hydroxy-5-deazaflavin:NADPH oxidoreductase